MKFRPFWELLKATFREWWNDNTFRLSASLAFYTIFSFAPMLLIAVGIASLIFSEEHARVAITSQLEDLIGGQGGAAISQVLKNQGRISGNPLAVILGIVTLFIGSTAVFAELQSALNQIWGIQVKPDRSVIKGLIRDRLLSFAIVLAVGFLLLVSLVISAGVSGAHAILNGLMPGFGWLWQVVNIITSLIVETVLFGMIYKYLPDVNITWRDVSVGALVTSVLFTLGKFLIGFYLGQTAIGSMYGAAGSFVVLLIWIYYSALICFLGAEFTQVYAHRYGSKIRPQAHAARIDEGTCPPQGGQP